MSAYPHVCIWMCSRNKKAELGFQIHTTPQVSKIEFMRSACFKVKNHSPVIYSDRLI